MSLVPVDRGEGVTLSVAVPDSEIEDDETTVSGAGPVPVAALDALT
jgi:hypothetical protein